MSEMFNTPFETALRIVIMLETEKRKDFSMNMIAAIDFAALYGRSFQISDVNLHSDNLFKFAEFAIRKKLAQEAVSFLVKRGLIIAETTKNGFLYRILDTGRAFAGSLDTTYADSYRSEVNLALDKYMDCFEQQIIQQINTIAVESIKEKAVLHE